MKKLRIYLDTSVVSHLKHDDTPDKMNDTVKLWRQFKNGLYEAMISDVTLDELAAAPESKAEELLGALQEINYTVLEQSPAVQTLAHEYIDSGALRQKSIDDCVHLAFATIYECDCITSWNFKHIVNLKTMTEVNLVNVKTDIKKSKLFLQR